MSCLEFFTLKVKAVISQKIVTFKKVFILAPVFK
jgi:hypothetical protein